MVGETVFGDEVVSSPKYLIQMGTWVMKCS